VVATATAHNAVSLELTHTATRRYFAFPAARPASMSTNRQGQCISVHKKWKCADRALVKYWYRKGKGA
jgi:hypothetical protein